MLNCRRNFLPGSWRRRLFLVPQPPLFQEGSCLTKGCVTYIDVQTSGQLFVLWEKTSEGVFRPFPSGFKEGNGRQAVHLPLYLNVSAKLRLPSAAKKLMEFANLKAAGDSVSSVGRFIP